MIQNIHYLILFVIAIIITDVQTGTGQQDSFYLSDQPDVYHVLEEVKFRNLTDSLLSEGFLSLSFDTLGNGKYSNIKITKGDVYNQLVLEKGNMDSQLFKTLRLNQSIDPIKWSQKASKIVDEFGKQGYPFVELYLDTFDLAAPNIFASLRIEPGKKVIYDELICHCDFELRETFIQEYLNIIPGQVYNHSDVKSIDQKLRQLKYVKLDQASKVSYFGNLSKVELFLSPGNASQFNFLIGVIPNNNEKAFLSFDIESKLQNKFGAGEKIHLQFQRLRPENQSIYMAVEYPYIFGLPISVEGNFGIFRNGLEFQDIKSELGGHYLIDENQTFGLIWKTDASRLINVDTSQLLTNQKLPSNLDVRKSGIELKAQYSNLDYIFNPIKGWFFQANVYAAQKRILENNSIKEVVSDDVDFINSYDSLNLKGYQINLSATIEKFTSLSNQMTILTKLKSGIIQSDLITAQNEMYRVGGNRLFRGFEELEFFTPWYHNFTSELRIILDDNAHLKFPFVDVGYIKPQGISNQWIIGIGAGIVLQTRVGLINFSIASGKRENQSFDIRNPKVHFGFSSIF